MPNIADIPLGWDYPRRKYFIDGLLDDKGKYTWQLFFQNELSNYQVFNAPLEMPKYRLTNGRTQAVQEEYLAKHTKLSKDFFNIDFEAEEAQKIQHELLLKMVEKTRLWTYFKDPKRRQDQPLILSHEGYVVNGNRRLCAMRTLYIQDKRKYSHFSTIEILILPKCDPRDIDELEAYLQIQPDVKEDYTWVAKACMLRARQQQHNYSIDDLARIYQIKEKDIKSILNRLDLVDQYLNESGKEKQYDLVEANDYAFRELEKGRRLLKDTDKKDLFTQLSYTFIDDKSTDVEGRLYQRIPDIRENLNLIADTLSQELHIELNETEPDNEYSLLGDYTSKYLLLTQAIAANNDKQNIVEIVLDVIDSQKELTKQRKRSDSVLREISEANAHIQNAIICTEDDQVTKIGVKEQIESIKEAISKIENWLIDDGTNQL